MCWLLTLPARMKSLLLEDFCSTYTYLYGRECKNRNSIFCLIGSKPVTIVPQDTLPQLLLSIAILHSLLKIMHNSYYFDIKLMTYRKQNISLQQINLNSIVVTRELKKKASWLKFFVDVYLHEFVFLLLIRTLRIQLHRHFYL